MVNIALFVKVFDQICRSRSESEVFDDFLDICICCLSGQQYEEEYLSVIKKYQKEEVLLFSELFAVMVNLMDADSQGSTDCLGEFFQQHITRGRNGQYFTPDTVCDFMGQILIDEETIGKTIMDPACGSGRMLLSTAKCSRNNIFFGADIDKRCSKMAAINLCLNGLIGEIAWMNSLSLEHWGGYEIFRDSRRLNVPTIRKLLPGEGYICQHPIQKEDKAEASEEAVPKETGGKQIEIEF